jgi:hypothetical protein
MTFKALDSGQTRCHDGRLDAATVRLEATPWRAEILAGQLLHYIRNRSILDSSQREITLGAIVGGIDARCDGRYGVRSIGWEEPDRAWPLNHPE